MRYSNNLLLLYEQSRSQIETQQCNLYLRYSRRYAIFSFVIAYIFISDYLTEISEIIMIDIIWKKVIYILVNKVTLQ